MVDNYVSYDAQTPSENEKVQARQNIGAMGLNSFDLYMNGAVPRPPVPPFFTQRIPNIVPGYTEFELINGLNHALLIEQTARQNTDLLLKENLEKETADRIQADNQLQENITTEATARENADNQLQQNINAEATARENGDTTLQNNINAEATARENADNQLQQNINAEATARENGDTTLQNNINAEATARENADNTLQRAITDETTARQGDTETVMGEIDGIKGREYKTVSLTYNAEIGALVSSLTGQEIYSIYENGIPLYMHTIYDNIKFGSGMGIICVYIEENIPKKLYFVTLNTITGTIELFYIPIDNTNIVYRAKDSNNAVDIYSLISANQNQNFNVSEKRTARNNIGAISEEDVKTALNNFVSATEIQNFTEEQKARARANIGAGTGGGTSEGAVLYDQAQSLTNDQKTQARKNIESVGYEIYEKGVSKTYNEVRFSGGTVNATQKYITTGGFEFTYDNPTKELKLEALTNYWNVMYSCPYSYNGNIMLTNILKIKITGEPTFTYPLYDANLLASFLGANAGNAVKRFFSGTLSITEAANVVTNCNVLEMYFLPFITSAEAGSSGSLKYKIVLEVTGVSSGSTHQVGDIITLYNKLWDNNYESVSGSVGA